MAVLKKALPIVFILLFVGLLIFSQIQTARINADPALVASRADLAEKSALEWQAKESYYKTLPSILVSGGYAFLAGLLGVGLILLTLSVSAHIAAGAWRKVITTGMGYVREDKDSGTTRVYLAAPNTVVAAHLNRIAERTTDTTDGNVRGAGWLQPAGSTGGDPVDTRVAAVRGDRPDAGKRSAGDAVAGGTSIGGNGAGTRRSDIAKLK